VGDELIGLARRIWLGNDMSAWGVSESSGNLATLN